MRLPSLKTLSRSRSVVKSFGGYHHTDDCGENEFYNETNLSARAAPGLCPRYRRTKLRTLAKPHGIAAKNGLVWVDGTTLYYNGIAVGQVSDTDKTFCGIGAKLLIWPDKKVLDTTKAGRAGETALTDLGCKWQSAGNVGFAPAQKDGSTCTITTTGSTAPESPANGEYWLDTASESDVLRVWSASQESWSAVPTTYLSIRAAGIGRGFALYDTVTISGVSADAVGEETAAMLNTNLVVWGRTDDSLTVTALIGKSAQQAAAGGAIKVERVIPDLDFIVEHDNRVWGCSSAGHAIFASKLGDPTNWFSYLGTAADSYAATVGSDGDFTGAAVCLGYVLFFKEGLVHKVYGTKPANYQVTAVACRGVRAGCAASLVRAGETLFYLSSDGVMGYDGGLPGLVSEAFGPVRYLAGAAGAQGGRCWFSLRDAAGAWSLFCYDTERNVWHREDALPAVGFAAGLVGGQGAAAGSACEVLYCLDAAGVIWAFGSDADPYAGAASQEEPLLWSAETGVIGLYTADRKTVSRIELRFKGEADAVLAVAAQYDSDGVWRPLGSWKGSGRLCMAVLPIVPHRHDHMRLRFSGAGETTLYTWSKLLEQGSEL